VLPALGYGKAQLQDLESTINRVDCDVVVVGTPIDLSRVLRIEKPIARASYHYEDAGDTSLAEIVLRALPL
jgi:predicted GTPase